MRIVLDTVLIDGVEYPVSWDWGTTATIETKDKIYTIEVESKNVNQLAEILDSIEDGAVSVSDASVHVEHKSQ